MKLTTKDVNEALTPKDGCQCELCNDLRRIGASLQGLDMSDFDLKDGKRLADEVGRVKTKREAI